MVSLEKYLLPHLIFKMPQSTPEQLFRFVGDVLKERGSISWWTN
jgi:hypothetical protein